MFLCKEEDKLVSASETYREMLATLLHHTHTDNRSLVSWFRIAIIIIIIYNRSLSLSNASRFLIYCGGSVSRANG